MNSDNPSFTEETVNKIIYLCSFGIPKGLGKPKEGQMCIEAIVSNALGLSHNDKPYSCVGEDIAKCKIRLNDCNWSSNKARAKGMLPLGIAQLGSSILDQKVFKERLRLNSTKRILPYLIQKHYIKVKDSKLLEYKVKFESLVELDDKLWKEFYNYYDYYDYYCNYDYYNYDYYHFNYYNHYNYYFGDEFLFLISDTILQTLKELKSPGCEYLHLITTT